MTQAQQAPTLAQWQALYNDQKALIKSPEGHQFVLIELAESLHAQGVIEAGELSDMLEQADAAYQWGVEAQLSAELHGPVEH